MKSETRIELRNFIDGIPTLKRTLNPDLAHPNDFRRLLKVSVALLDHDDSIDEYDIQRICEEIGGKEYVELLENTLFIDHFAIPMFLEIVSAKNVISVYRELSKL